MMRTFGFYLWRSYANRFRAAVKRLRQPKYAISALVGFGYFYLIFLRHFFERSASRAPMPAGMGTDLLPLIEAFGSFGIFLLVILAWLWPGRGSGGLKFTEAEVQFLFPAPVSRRTLVHFRLIKMQLGTLFGVVISFLIFGRGRFFDHPFYFMVALWLVYSFLGLYAVGVNLVQTSLAEHGVSGWKRQSWTFGVLAALVVSVGVWMRSFIPPLPESGSGDLSALKVWILQVAESGPAYYFLYPFRVLVHPAFASDPASFLVRLAPAIMVVGVVYFWVICTDASFEEASLEKAQKTALRIQAIREGRARGGISVGPKIRRPIFTLAEAGWPHMPIFWKNLISIGRMGMLRMLLALMSIGISLTIVFSSQGRAHILPTLIGTISMMIAGFLALLGPMMIRDDLRCDLLHAELLKTYPIQGWQLVLGEVLAPASVLGAIQCALLVIAAVAIPSLGKMPLTFARRIELGSSAVVLLPCFSLIGVLVQNAAALIWPGWVELGRGRRQGIEAMGQRMITMICTLVALIVAILPAGLVFALVFFLGSMVVGWAIAPIAAIAAACVLLAETGFAIFWLGRIYDHFDLSKL